MFISYFQNATDQETKKAAMQSQCDLPAIDPHGSFAFVPIIEHVHSFALYIARGMPVLLFGKILTNSASYTLAQFLGASFVGLFIVRLLIYFAPHHNLLPQKKT